MRNQAERIIRLIQREFTSQNLSVFIFFAALLTLEFSVSFDLQYTSLNFAPYLGPCLIYGGLALGQLVAYFMPKKIGAGLRRFPWILGLLVFLFLGLGSRDQEHFILYTLFLFVPFGYFSAQLYDSFPFRSVLFPASFAGLVLSGFALQIASLDTQLLKSAVLILLGLSFGLAQTPRSVRGIKWLGLGTLLLLALVAKFPLESASISYINSINPTMTKFAEPYYSPFLRTDIFYDGELDQHILVTNGTFLAVVAKTTERNSKFLNLSVGADGRALIIGAAGGRNILGLRKAGFESVTAVDINPNVFKIVREHFGESSGFVYDLPGVKPVSEDGRRFLIRSKEKFDLIVVERVGSGGKSGSFAEFFESFIYTQEAFLQMWNHLSERGAIYISEYEDSRRLLDGEMSLVQKIAQTVFCIPEMQGANIQMSQREQSHAMGYIPKRQRKLETIVISKRPLSAVVGPGATLKDFQGSRECSGSLTDDRPWFSGYSRWIPYFWWYYVASLMFLVIISIYLIRSQKIEIRHALISLGAGANYLFWIIGISGILSLVLPLPTQVTPATLFLTFLAGFINYFLRRFRLQARWAIPIGVLWCTAVICILKLASSAFASVEFSTALILFACMLLPCFIFAELPYIFVVMSHGRQLNTILLENLGSLFGILLGYFIKALAGYSSVAGLGILMSAILIYLLLPDKKIIALRQKPSP